MNADFNDTLELIKRQYAETCQSDPQAARRFLILLNALTNDPAGFWELWFLHADQDSEERKQAAGILEQHGSDLTFEQAVVLKQRLAELTQ